MASGSTNSRKRTNLLKDSEAASIAFLCRIMPSWITSDLLTIIGFIGGMIVITGLYLGRDNKYWLLLSILGFAIGWFGDSLDGRLAYFRNIPRKWYGWALDITVDWLSIGIMGIGYYYFFDEYKFVAFVFVFTYGWSMINTLLKYKITDKYSIDTFLMGPTELRILICIFLFLEIYIDNLLFYFGIVGSLILMLINVNDFREILSYGDDRDKLEKANKQESKG